MLATTKSAWALFALGILFYSCGSDDDRVPRAAGGEGGEAGGEAGAPGSP